MPSPTDFFLRSWLDPNRNKQVEVYYDAGLPRRIFKEETAIDPAGPMAGGGTPQDGVPAGTVLARLVEGAEEVVITASQTSPFAVLSVRPYVPPTGGGATCDLLATVQLAAGATAAVVNATLSGSTTAGDGLVQVAVNGAAASAFQALPVVVALPARTAYTLVITDRAGCAQTLRGQTPRFGCTDPNADNYDPLATRPDLSCAYSPRLLATAVPQLVANGRPVPVVLTSTEVPGAVPSAAEAFIEVDALSGAVGVELTVNGYRLSSGPIVLPTNFVDAPTLAEALQAIPALAAAYLIRLSQDTVVRLSARAEGTPGNLVITTSDSAAIVVVSLPGVNRYRSQGRAQWGCFVEVWTGAPETNPSTFSDTYTDAYRDRYGLLTVAPGGPAAPVLAQRMELPYRPDNAYEFDIAPALRQFTGHAYPLADGSCPDRLVSYFLRFGELYAQGGTVRRQQSVYQTGVGWALDAVELLPELPTGGRLLSKRPAPWRTNGRTNGRSGGPTVLLGNEPGPGVLATTLTRTAFDGSPSSSAGPDISQGRVTRVAWPADYFAGQLTGTLRLAATVLPRLSIVAAPAAEITFANSVGGFDTVLFEGVREEITKRTEASYATPTGTATRSATTPEAFRLQSGPLDRATWLWLRTELGNSPAAWLETEAGPQALRLTGFAPDADEVAGTYSLAVDCEPQLQPNLGLTN